VPHAYNTEAGLRYYLEMLKRLKERIEKFLGTKIEEKHLRKSVALYNEMRSLFKEISFLRKDETPPITGKDFIKLMHGSFYLDPEEMVEILQSVLALLKSKKKEKGNKQCRILLTGNMLAVGDYKVIEMIEDVGGSLVIEQFCGGMRHYLANVNLSGDLLEALARRYLSGREPCAFMRPSRERLDLVIKLAKEFRVDGVIWYQLRYCDTYNMEFFYFNNIMKEIGLPVLKLESEYDVEERGTLLNRIESFIESMERRN
jgi:benzoyl-CoA reductase/2-hydroxyglutaryl-CoA dehydratase subunit BcrC/BadD/HgdB